MRQAYRTKAPVGGWCSGEPRQFRGCGRKRAGGLGRNRELDDLTPNSEQFPRTRLRHARGLAAEARMACGKLRTRCRSQNGLRDARACRNNLELVRNIRELDDGKPGRTPEAACGRPGLGGVVVGAPSGQTHPWYRRVHEEDPAHWHVRNRKIGPHQ